MWSSSTYGHREEAAPLGFIPEAILEGVLRVLLAEVDVDRFGVAGFDEGIETHYPSLEQPGPLYEAVKSRTPATAPRKYVSRRPLPLVQLATRRYDLDLPAALDEVVDDERDDNEDDRERKKPGPPAVSCDEHNDLRCWG